MCGLRQRERLQRVDCSQSRPLTVLPVNGRSVPGRQHSPRSQVSNSDGSRSFAASEVARHVHGLVQDPDDLDVPFA